jgi:hypothetical protein
MNSSGSLVTNNMLYQRQRNKLLPWKIFQPLKHTTVFPKDEPILAVLK